MIKNSYKGTFDGQNHRVTGMVIRGEKNEQGFFGNIDGKGTVKNLKISGDINVTGDSPLHRWYRWISGR